MPEPTEPWSPQEFREASLTHLSSLYRFSRQMVRDENEANDLVQQTYLHAYKSMGTYRGPVQKMRPWLFRVLHNVLSQKYRKDKRLRFDEELLADQVHEDRSELLTPNPKLEDVDWEQVDGKLKAAIGGLPEGLRLIFLLFAVEDMRYRDLSEILNIPIGTVMSRLARARRLLIAQLTQSESSDTHNHLRMK